MLCALHYTSKQFKAATASPLFEFWLILHVIKSVWTGKKGTEQKSKLRNQTDEAVKATGTLLKERHDLFFLFFFLMSRVEAFECESFREYFELPGVFGITCLWKHEQSKGGFQQSCISKEKASTWRTSEQSTKYYTWVTASPFLWSLLCNHTL